MSTVSVGGGGGLIPTPFDETDWLECACGKRADGSEFIFCCGHNFGEGSGTNEGAAIQHETSEKHIE